MSYAAAEHDRMIAALVMPCQVVAVQLSPPRVRVQSGDWTSGWVRWHSQAAGKARHWRAPSLLEQGVLFSPSGEAGAGTFVPGLYGDAGAPPDNRDHVEVWRFDDGGSLVYDWKAKRYDIQLPEGTVQVTVGGASVTVTPEQVAIKAATIVLDGNARVTGTLDVAGNITGGGSIMDTTGNSNHHAH